MNNLTEEKTIQISDGVALYFKTWNTERPKGLIVINHGFGEHINRYNHVADFFNQHGYAVAGYDMRGHGKSEGKRGHSPNYETYLNDIQIVINEAQKNYPALPVILWGHSMGGNLVASYLLQRNPPIKAVVLTGPWILPALPPKPILLFLGKMMRNIAPSFTQNVGIKPEDISRDTSVVQAYKNDPLVHSKMTASAGMSVVEAGEALNVFSGDIKIPLLVMHGDQDKLTSSEASKAFASRITGPVTFKMWHGLYHELHNDPEKEEVLEYAFQWIEHL